MDSIQLRFFAPNVTMTSLPGLGVVHPCVYNVLRAVHGNGPKMMEVTGWEIDYEWIDLAGIDLADTTRVPADTFVEGGMRIFYPSLKLSMAHFFSPPNSRGRYLIISFDPTEICAWLKDESNNWARLASYLAVPFLDPHGFAWFDDELVLDELDPNASFTSIHAMAWLNIYGKQIFAQLPSTFRESLLSNVKPFEISDTGFVVPCFEGGSSPHDDDFGATEYAFSHSLDGISIRGIRGPKQQRGAHSTDKPFGSKTEQAIAKYGSWLKFWTTRRQLRKVGLERVVEDTWPTWPKFPK